jgi:hypothetical protein
LRNRSSLYDAAAAPVLLRPVFINSQRMMESPLNGEIYPAAYEDQFVAESGTLASGLGYRRFPRVACLFGSRGVLGEPRYFEVGHFNWTSIEHRILDCLSKRLA